MKRVTPIYTKLELREKSVFDLMWQFTLSIVLMLNSVWAADTTYSVNTTLTSDQRLHSTSRAIFSSTLTLEGSGFNFKFPSTSSATMLVDSSVTATLQNTL